MTDQTSTWLPPHASVASLDDELQVLSGGRELRLPHVVVTPYAWLTAVHWAWEQHRALDQAIESIQPEEPSR